VEAKKRELEDKMWDNEAKKQKIEPNPARQEKKEDPVVKDKNPSKRGQLQEPPSKRRLFGEVTDEEELDLAKTSGHVPVDDVLPFSPTQTKALSGKAEDESSSSSSEAEEESEEAEEHTGKMGEEKRKRKAKPVVREPGQASLDDPRLRSPIKSQPSPKKAPPGKRTVRKKKLVTKMYKDEEGFIVQKQVEEWVEEEEDDVPQAPVAPCPNDNSGVPKSTPPLKTTKQGNLMGFFQRK